MQIVDLVPAGLKNGANSSFGSTTVHSTGSFMKPKLAPVPPPISKTCK